MSIYRVGVELALINKVSAGLALISAEMLSLQGKTAALTAAFAKMRLAAIGAVQVFAGVEMFHGLNKFADAGKELIHQQELMRLQGWKQADMLSAWNEAWKISGTITTTTASENLKHLRELSYATGEMHEAIAILPEVTKANAILNSLKGGGTDEVWNLVKALEEKGLTNKENRGEFLSYVNQMTQAVEASGGRVSPKQFQSAFVYGRTARLGWNQEFITEILPRLIQSMSIGNGSGQGTTGPGNALMSLFAKLVQGQMTKKGANVLRDLGLTEEYKDIAGSASAMVKIKGATMATENPYEWLQTYMWPALQAKGLTDKKEITGIIQEIAQALQVRTASDIAAQMVLFGRARLGEEASPFEKDRRLKRQAMEESKAFEGLAGKDPFTVLLAYHQQMMALTEAVGKPMMEMKLDVVKGLTPMFTALAQFSAANPDTIRALAIAIAGLAAALTVAGIGLIAAAIGPAGWLVAGIAALAAAFVALQSPLESLLQKLGLHQSETAKEAAKITDLDTGFERAAQANPGLRESYWEALGHRFVQRHMAKQISAEFNQDLSALPGEVQPGIDAAVGGIAARLNSALAGIAGQIGSPIDKMSWNPTAGGAKPIQINHTTHLDGRILARSVSNHIVDGWTFPRTAPYHDGYGGYSDPGQQIVTT